MTNIYDGGVAYASEGGCMNNREGASTARFIKVADAMLAYGVVQGIGSTPI